MKKITHVVEKLYVPQRIDSYLSKALEGEFSREMLKKALEAGKILLNGKAVRPDEKVSNGDKIEGELKAREDFSLSAEKIPLEILYEDASLLVVNKPAGMVVHPGAGNKQGTLVNALLGRGGDLSSLGEKERPGIVHRLDKDTSGILLVAKNNAAHRALQTQFAERSLSKTYFALVKGRVEFQEGHIDASIGQDPHVRQKKAVSIAETAREAHTLYRVVRRFKYSTLLEVNIITGRTHQIRVHMAHLGYPVVGDKLYGNVNDPRRLALHAAKIEFSHPKTGKMIKFECPIPEDFSALIQEAENA